MGHFVHALVETNLVGPSTGVVALLGMYGTAGYIQLHAVPYHCCKLLYSAAPVHCSCWWAYYAAYLCSCTDNLASCSRATAPG